MKLQFERMMAAYLQVTQNLKRPVISSSLTAIPEASENAHEMEVRFFATNNRSASITKIQYYQIIEHLYATGFITDFHKGVHYLRMYYDLSSINKNHVCKNGASRCTFDKHRELLKKWNIRTEIESVDLIQEYCITNDIQTVLDRVKFTSKHPLQDATGQTVIAPVKFADYGFSVHFQKEEDLPKSDELVDEIIQHWKQMKRFHRLINRVRFYHPSHPFFVDVSIVKSSKFRSSASLQDSGIFTAPETYEIEIEMDNSRIFDSQQEAVLPSLRSYIRQILGVFQNTAYPISFKEMNDVQTSYLQLIGMGKKFPNRSIKPSDFIGPSSTTLQMENILPVPGEEAVPNSSSAVAHQPVTYTILNNMTVTEKADGERRLLFVAPTGKIYMINMNMDIIFTGVVTKKSSHFNSLIDGEYIPFNKLGKKINLYMAFDAYFMNGKDVRAFDLMEGKGRTGAPQEAKTTGPYSFRLTLLQEFVKDVVASTTHTTMTETSCHFAIRTKAFKTGENIFTLCKEILDDQTFEYNTDGLIFTPANTGVGGYKSGETGPLKKITWKLSFKWKPPSYNTIDFYVVIKKNKHGEDDIQHVFTDGKVQPYKTLLLMCGGKERDVSNPYQSILDDKVVIKQKTAEEEDEYKALYFYPDSPVDINACYCNVLLKQNEDDWVMTTEDGTQIIEDKMIVECKYDATKASHWRWVPIRIRHDKTGYGNHIYTANDNWKSIHSPVTKEIITTGANLPIVALQNVVEIEDVYYNQPRNQNTSLTQALRVFHNIFVKSKLIHGVSGVNGTLIDYACGKGGDLPKWFHSKLSFVFGIDISKDNIMNKVDGACKRYINYVNRFHHDSNYTKCIFLVGNTSQNIRSAEAFQSEDEKKISNCLFGNAPPDRSAVGGLGRGVLNKYQVAKNGFQVSSIQFALHYFFRDVMTLQAFLRNVSECTALNGYFIGTCFDGLSVFQKLKSLKKDEDYTIFKEGKRIFQINKKYEDGKAFSDDETSLGMAIDVYQETINNTFREYLVNFKYLSQLLIEYGFQQVTKEDAVLLGIPNGSGYFRDIFLSLNEEWKSRKWGQYNERDYQVVLSMSKEEQDISFLNRYFVFRKIREVDSKNIYMSFVKEHEKRMEESSKESAQEAVQEGEEEEEEEEPSMVTKMDVNQVPLIPSQEREIGLSDRTLSDKVAMTDDSISLSKDEEIQKKVRAFMDEAPPEPAKEPANKATKKRSIKIKTTVAPLGEDKVSEAVSEALPKKKRIIKPKKTVPTIIDPTAVHAEDLIVAPLFKEAEKDAVPIPAPKKRIIKPKVAKAAPTKKPSDEGLDAPHPPPLSPKNDSPSLRPPNMVEPPPPPPVIKKSRPKTIKIKTNIPAPEVP